MNYIKKTLILIFLGLLHQQAMAQSTSRSCFEYLSPNQSATILSDESILSWTLESALKDDDDVLNVTPSFLENYALAGDQDGRLIYQKSKHIIMTSISDIFIAVWDIKNQAPGTIYGGIEKKSRNGTLKHSSFNQNQPVLSAWLLESSNGYITKIIDGSGHYRPNPFNIYLTLKKLIELGLNLNSTMVEFNHGLSFIKGINISALDLITAVENLNPEDLKKLGLIKFNKPNLRFFLDLIYEYTQDNYTKALIELYHIRNQSWLDYNKIQNVLDIINSGTVSENQIYILLGGLFNSNHKFISGKSQIRYQGQDKQQKYYSDLKSFIQSRLSTKLPKANITTPHYAAAGLEDNIISIKEIVESWLILNNK